MIGMIENYIESSIEVFKQLIRKEIEELENKKNQYNSILNDEREDRIKQLYFIYENIEQENSLKEIDEIVKIETERYNKKYKEIFKQR